MVAVSVAVPVFPAASVAVAVQILTVFDVTLAGVNKFVAALYAPPLVHVTVGPLVIATLSVAERVDVAVWPEATVNVAGLKDKTGADVSGGGGGVIVTVKVPDP